MKADFPFLLYDQLETNWKIDVNRSSFHSDKCYHNNFMFTSIEKEPKVCEQCEQLQYNIEINKIVKRSHECEAHTSYKYLSSTQLNEKLIKKNEIINDHKLASLKFRTQLVNLKNAKNDYERLVTLLSQNDIPGSKYATNLLVS